MSFPFRSYEIPILSTAETEQKAHDFYESMDARRSVRHFSDKPVPRSVIEKLILTASTAPSGAHKQPWTFCAVKDPSVKSQIRAAAEKEEFDSYNGGCPHNGSKTSRLWERIGKNLFWILHRGSSSFLPKVQAWRRRNIIMCRNRLVSLVVF